MSAPAPAPAPAPGKSVLSTFFGNVLFAILFVAVAAGYFAYDRLYNKSKTDNVDQMVLFDEYPKLKFIPGNPGQVVFGDGTKVDRDGFAFVLFQPSDWDKNAERLKGLSIKPGSSDFPLLISLNPSGFDVSGEPIAIRRAEDGRLLYQAPLTPQLVDFTLPQRDGSCKVRFVSGKILVVSEQEWLKVFMRSNTLAPPVGFEKMSDEELKKHGFERLSTEEVDKRIKTGKLKPDQVFPLPRPPEKK